MIKRLSEQKILDMSKKFPVLVLTGPRQSGKTTLVKKLFSTSTYVSLEDPDMRLFAEDDPRGFLNSYPSPLVIDEAQNVPKLFSYIQRIVDEKRQNGQYIFTGSQNFLLLEKVNQSLAGRAYIHNLLPFSREELTPTLSMDMHSWLFKGGYPRIYDQEIEPTDFYPAYTQTYLERDVRKVLNVKDLALFTSFVKLCAGRVGQVFNASSLGNDLGIDHKTVTNWINVLEASFVLFRLQPWHENFSKRLIKSPKLYFYDTGLLCSLLGIRSTADIDIHFAKGSLFENFCITEILKARLNSGEQGNLYFWRDSSGHEIDLIIDNGISVDLVEFKAGSTFKPDSTKNLFWFIDNAHKNYEFSPYLVYGGDEGQKRKDFDLLSWKDLNQITHAN
jgi:predicted AAA+ superfamily ATPase